MSHINDGGPAYPVWELNGNGEQEMTCVGMSIRDSFAEKAMQGITLFRQEHVFVLSDYELARIARLSYKMADAMIAARSYDDR